MEKNAIEFAPIYFLFSLIIRIAGLNVIKNYVFFENFFLKLPGE